METFWVVFRVRLSRGADPVLYGTLVDARSAGKATKRARRKVEEAKPGAVIVEHVSTESHQEKRRRDMVGLFVGATKAREGNGHA